VEKILDVVATANDLRNGIFATRIPIRASTNITGINKNQAAGKISDIIGTPISANRTILLFLCQIDLMH
jgi:hypothetical protein